MALWDDTKNWFKKIIDTVFGIGKKTNEAVSIVVNHPAVQSIAKPIGNKIDEVTGKKYQEEVAQLLFEWEKLLKACTTRIETLEEGYSELKTELDKVTTPRSTIKAVVIFSFILSFASFIGVIVLFMKVFH